ncbi:crotonase/enoyl-CoA hydratase family protein [Yoonia maritima]|uniref:crotonase/enoyl-CoA hydratase family protein n=1 Tax=Yoonia maritima TaxID=1435347 RepID=UPI003735D1C2
MEYETLDVSVDQNGVVSLALDVAEKRNALSATMIAELTHFARTARDRPEMRVVVLSGRGKVFCAGGDLDWMKAQIAADRTTRMTEARKLADMLRALNDMPLSLIAKITGGAFGGGVGIACVSDIVIAEAGAKFGLTETRLGLIPATIGPYVINRMGEGRARQIMLSARIFDAPEAEKLGIVSKCCDADELDAAVDAEISPFLDAAPNAVAAAKKLAREMGTPITDAMVDDSIARLADVWEHPEAKEGIEAFFAKRKPSWAMPR